MVFKVFGLRVTDIRLSNHVSFENVSFLFDRVESSHELKDLVECKEDYSNLVTFCKSSSSADEHVSSLNLFAFQKTDLGTLESVLPDVLLSVPTFGPTLVMANFESDSADILHSQVEDDVHKSSAKSDILKFDVTAGVPTLPVTFKVVEAETVSEVDFVDANTVPTGEIVITLRKMVVCMSVVLHVAAFDLTFVVTLPSKSSFTSTSVVVLLSSTTVPGFLLNPSLSSMTTSIIAGVGAQDVSKGVAAYGTTEPALLSSHSMAIHSLPQLLASSTVVVHIFEQTEAFVVLLPFDKFNEIDVENPPNSLRLFMNLSSPSTLFLLASPKASLAMGFVLLSPLALLMVYKREDFVHHAPRISRANLVKGTTAHALANAAAQEILIAHWQGNVKRLGNFLNVLKTNHAGLAELEHWCYKATDEYAGTAWDELKHIRQAIGQYQERYNNPRGKDLAMVRVLSLRRNAIDHAK
ncbi:myosin-11 [Phtheirospermum japonicum]|uniref:Myosin-11 n=1 Tax=Phtheirospermum japonicum TaxID=374723 RepID=A0A830BPS4_9LAMI|nr:myosin-11 [Phtheirospermum japonicum]